MRSKHPGLLTLLAVWLFQPWGMGAAAQEPERQVAGTLFVRGADGVTRPALALATDVEIVVTGLVARVRVMQQFRNDTSLWLDGTYVFPLPGMAAVDRMVLQVGDRRIEGQIRERDAAKRSFERARREGRAASLLEQERPNLFTTSVANIGPRDYVDVEIEYQETVRYEQGGFELRFPMTLTSRYAPGAAGDTEDVAPITPLLLHPDAGVVNPVTLRVELDAGLAIERVESPSHAIQTFPLGEGVQEVWLEKVPADRDFVLRWAPKPGAEPRAVVFSEEHAGEHYALLLVIPPEADAEAHRLPREAIFVIDTSGSMAGASIEQARAALHLALDHLGPDDTFNVIAFDSETRALFATSEPAGEASVRRAHAFVDRLKASGGTEMLPALRLALRDPSPDRRRVRQIVFVTDGSIGNEAELFAAIERELGESRLFMVGIGSAPNSFLVERSAALGRGTVTHIGSTDEVRERMEALFRKLARPALRDIEVRWNDAVEMWPERVPDLYAGEPVVVTARLARFVGDVRILGERGGRSFDMRLPLTPGAQERGIHKLWARRKIAHWMGRQHLGADAEQVREEVLALALEHQLVSRYTSLVAVDVTPRRPVHAAGARTRVPNHGPAGFDPNRVPGVLPQGGTPAQLLLWTGTALLGAAAGLRRHGARA